MANCCWLEALDFASCNESTTFALENLWNLFRFSALGMFRGWEHLTTSGINSRVLQAKICTARSRKVFHGNLREIDMGRSQSLTSRAICTRVTAIVVTCPKCKRRSIFPKSTAPLIDRCGFENHSFRCAWCASLFAGIIDPSDGEILLSLLDEPISVTATPPSDPLSGQHDLQCDTRLHGTDEQGSS
jgi:hypothetical protein